MKFCKCVDQPQEYEKIVKLIEGGQGVAAVDRINQLLSKTPNAAWLLAIKGELSLSLQEMETFKETANRFLKLKPDNPLALIMKSMVATLDGEPLENSARYLLDGMSEARESLPALALSAIQLLTNALLAAGRKSMVGYWTDVLTALTSGDEGPTEETALSDPEINLLAKAPAKIIEDPPRAAWKERLAEVQSLARTFRFAQAETKLRAILRDFPDQPGPLSQLLRAQCALLDQPGAAATARKLSGKPDVKPEDRAYFAAVAYELEPNQTGLQTPRLVRYCKIDSEDLIEQVLLQFDFVHAAEGEGGEKVRRYYAYLVGDEVPAKRVYSVYNVSLKQPAEGQEQVIGSSVGTIVLFGKQTDQPSRLLLSFSQFPAYSDIIQKVLDGLDLGEEIEGTQVPEGTSYIEFLKRPKAIPGALPSPLTIEQRGQELVEDFLKMPIKCLDDRSPLEAADDEKCRTKLLGLLCHLEGEQSIVVPAKAIAEIYQRLGIERPMIAVDPQEKSLKLVSIVELDRVDVDSLNDSQLKGLIIRSMEMGASRVFYRCALAVRSRASLVNDIQLQVAAMSGLINMVPDLEERIVLCEQLEEVLIKAKAAVGKIIIQRLGLLHAVGRSEEAQRVLMEAVQKYPEDPYLMSFIQYAMQNQGRAPAAVGTRNAGGDELAMGMQSGAGVPMVGESSGSGLVLPGQEAGNKPGASKLWLPGS